MCKAQAVISEFIVGNEGEVLVVSGGKLAWASTSPAASHGILSVTHSDTNATGTLERGDILTVDSTGKWNRLVARCTPIDVYTGEQIEAGKKSIAYHVVFRSPRGTLNADQVNNAQAEILRQLQHEVGATLRD